MKANVKLIRKRRRYSEDFKRELVQAFESGQYSVLQLSRLHGVSFQSIYQWIYRYSTVNEKGYRVVEKEKSSSQRVKDLEKRVAELEQAVGRKQIQIDYLEKLIELAKEELEIDIKKNYDTPRFGGSGKTREK